MVVFEIIILVINICVVSIAFKEGHSTDKDNLGTAVIILNLLLYVLNFLFLILKLLKGIKVARKMYKEDGVKGKMMFLNL